MRSRKWCAAGVLIILFGAFGCSDNGSPTAPMQTTVSHSSNSTSIQPNNNQVSMVGVSHPNPLVGTLGTIPGGCRVIYVDPTNYIILDIDAPVVPFQLVDGMTLIARGHYISNENEFCPGAVFEATSLSSAGSGGSNLPPNNSNIQ